MRRASHPPARTLTRLLVSLTKVLLIWSLAVSAASPAPFVFDPEWIAKQKSKYGPLPDYERPKPYWFWTSDESQGLRDLIEQWVDPLQTADRQKIISRLRQPKLFEQTRNELAVGDSLRRMGHTIEYEAELQGLTPDWF